MNLIKVAASVINQTALDWIGNRERIRAVITEARAQEVSVLCLPELCITGYGCEDAFHSVNTCERAWEMLMVLLPETRGLIVSFGLPVLHQKGIFNCAAFVVDGQLIGLVAKRFLPGDGIHYEPRWFKPWPQGVQNCITIGEKSVPIGDLYFDVGGVRIGFEICEDAWVAKRPGAALAAQGVDIILNPSASHFGFGKSEIRKRLVLEGSRAFGAAYVYSNLLGNEAGRIIYDGGALVASGGKLVAVGPRFGFRDFYLTPVIIDLNAARWSQARITSFQPALANDADGLVAIPFKPGRAALELAKVQAPNWETSHYLKEEEFFRAEALGLFDYMRKSRSNGFVVSLSGGADSAATVCLVHLSLHLALQELGADCVREKLKYMKDLPLADARSLTQRLLSTVYQSAKNSGLVTREAARKVAETIGAKHLEWDVSEMIAAYARVVEQATGVRLNWQEHDITLQNIQARSRSPGVWMLANLNNALLISTSNRSEAAVGYATMDGDTSGGLSPLAGIDKAWLRHWLRWLEETGPEGVGPLPALKAVNQQAPTAELRPSTSGQTDEDDLMPYDLLDTIERAAIRDKRSPLEVFQFMRLQFPQYTHQQLGAWTERFFRLWSRNQWKRERYAPSFHLDDENLDPKTWCRFPILSGGFEVELKELREVISNLG